MVITRTQREISLIREYRTRLIADVVTGKVDVRGVAVELAEEVEEIEAAEAEGVFDPEETTVLEEES